MAQAATRLRNEDFEPFIGRPVEVTGAPETPLVLESVQVGPAASPAYPPSFIVLFRGPKPGPILPEGLHRCRVADGPTFDLYLQPIHTPARDRQDYQSVFN